MLITIEVYNIPLSVEITIWDSGSVCNINLILNEKN